MKTLQFFPFWGMIDNAIVFKVLNKWIAYHLPEKQQTKRNNKCGNYGFDRNFVCCTFLFCICQPKSASMFRSVLFSVDPPVTFAATRILIIFSHTVYSHLQRPEALSMQVLAFVAVHWHIVCGVKTILRVALWYDNMFRWWRCLRCAACTRKMRHSVNKNRVIFCTTQQNKLAALVSQFCKKVSQAVKTV